MRARRLVCLRSPWAQRLKLMQSSLFAPFDRLIAPPPHAQRVAFLSAQPYAHRGLHGDGRIENSRAAFTAAIAAGHGIELDVQPAREGEAFVFHDPMLDRLTDSSGPFGLHSAHELDQIRLRGSHETIPRLSEILALVAGRVPVLIEIKANEAAVASFASASAARFSTPYPYR